MWDDLSISEDTKQMLNKLLEHHQKKESYLLKARVLVICLCLLGFSFAVYLYSHILLPANQRLDKAIALMFSDQAALFLFLGIVAAYGSTMYYFTKYKSTKQKLDKLRGEAVDRLNTVWVVSNKSQLKDQISIRMQRCGVNMSHKEK